MDTTITRRSILPPGSNETVTYGILWIRLGDLKLFKQTSASQKISVLFWGEASPCILQAANCVEPQHNRRAEYEVRTSAVIFRKYLEDMKAMTKLTVEGVGTVKLDLRPFLLSVSERSKQVFEHFKGQFEVMGKDRLAGTLEIEMGCNFNPEIHSIEENQEESCCCECHEESEEECECECHQKNLNKAVNILAVKQPWKLEEFVEKTEKIKESLIKDPRVPSSLQKQMPSNSQFFANRYIDQIKPIVPNLPSPKIVPKESVDKSLNISHVSPHKMFREPDSIKQHEIQYCQNSSISSLNNRQESPNKEEFPQFQKILTYSNLQLEKQLKGNEQQALKRQFYESGLKRSNYSPSEQSHSYVPERQEDQPRNLHFSPTIVQDNKSQEVDYIERSYLTKNVSNEEMNPINVAPYRIEQQNASGTSQSNSNNNNNNNNGNQKQAITFQRNHQNPFADFIGPSPSNFRPLAQHPPLLQTNAVIPRMNTTNLLLNLHCEIGCIKLDTPVLFHLVYKTYGDCVRNRLEYKGETLTIINPIGAEQMRLMDKLPYIVEVRNSRDKDKLIGVVKVSLEKVKSAYLINGSINEKVIKANVMPVIILQGETDIAELKGEVRGQAHINLLLGTGEQISNYLNQQKKQSTKSEREQMKTREEVQYVIKEDNKVNLPETLIAFMMYLRTQNTKIADSLLRLMNQKQLDLEAYRAFLQHINRIEYLPLFNLFDYKRKGSFSTKILADSFRDFNKLYEKLEEEHSARAVMWRSVPSQIVDLINRNSEFGLIKKDSLRQILEQNTSLSERSIEELLKLSAEPFLSLEELKREKNNSLTSPAFYGQAVCESLQQTMISQNLQPRVLLSELKETSSLSVAEINKVFKVLEGADDSLSLLSIVLLIHSIKDKNKDKNKVKDDDCLSIGYVEFCNWILSLEESIQKQKYRREQREKQKQRQREEQRQRQKEKQRKKLSQDKNILNNNIANDNKSKIEENKQQEIQYGLPVERTDEPKKEVMQQEPEEVTYTERITYDLNPNPDKREEFQETEKREQISYSPLRHDQKPQVQQQPNQLYSHQFTIEGVQVGFSSPVVGECSVNYRFPQEEELVRSKSFHAYSDKQKYAIRLLGKHTLNINIPVQGYLGENILKIDLVLNGKVLCAGGVPCSDLLESETKTVGLFSSGQEPTLLGKLKLRVKYQKEKAKEGRLGQTISKEMYLPKVGYVNIEISSAMEKKKLAQEFKLKDDCFLFMSVDLFHLSPELSSAFPPIVSRVQSTVEDIVYLRESLKLRLTENIIEYMKNSSLRISLVTVSYKQEMASKRRMEMVVGTIDIPMLSLVNGNGVHGDYAFKSKFGIFVGLARCDISYSKNKVDFVEKSENVQRHSKENVYVVVNLLELLNLGEQIKWVSFECSQYGHQATSKNHLSGNKFVNYLEPSCLFMEIADLYSISHILVTMKSSLQAHLHFEINTRPLINSLTKHRHTAFSNYFSVVGDDVEPIRVGAKVYAFRGNELAKTLATSIKNSPLCNVFQYLEVPKELDNYPKMLDILRKQLEIEKGSFDELLNYILEPKQRINIELFTSQILFRLDFLQLSCEYPIDYGIFAEQPSTLLAQQLLELIEYSGLEIQGFKGKQTLDKFTFKNLDMHKIDRNVELHTMDDKVDVLTFLRKLVVPEEEAESGHQEQSLDQRYRMVVGVEKAKNLETLYNGVKPNAVVRCSSLNLETAVVGRDANPEYNEEFQFQITPDELQKMKSLHFEVQHKTSLEESSLTKIVIGRGTLNLPPTAFKQGSAMFSIPISSNKSSFKSSKKPELIVRIRMEKIEESSEQYDYMRSNEFENSNLQSNLNNTSLYQNTLKRETVNLDRIAQIINEQPQEKHHYAFDESDESDNSYSLY